MPTYEYLCDKCGDQFEWEQEISAHPLSRCDQPLTDETRAGAKYKWRREGGDMACTVTLANGSTVELCAGTLRRLLFAPGFSLQGKRWERDGYSG